MAFKKGDRVLVETFVYSVNESGRVMVELPTWIDASDVRPFTSLPPPPDDTALRDELAMRLFLEYDRNEDITSESAVVTALRVADIFIAAKRRYDGGE